ncbi:MAG: exosortase T [Solimonas sp.]
MQAVATDAERAQGLWALLLRPSILLFAAAALLAIHPALWLFASWRDPAYNAQGLWLALAVSALAAWSYTSEELPGTGLNQRYAWVLLAASAAVRFAGQLLRVNVIGALTLAVDVYALATLAGLHQRRRAVSPFWLAVLFAFSLPLERVVQRLAGYALQQGSAAGACAVLGQFEHGVRCIGTRILLDGQDLLVDLPCSGARGLTLLLSLYALLAALCRPGPRAALAGLLLTLAGAFAANLLRLVALAVGLARPHGIDWMAAPWHELLGVSALALGALPLLLWARRVTPLPVYRRAPRPPPDAGATVPRWRRLLPALLLLVAAGFAVSAPATPVDVTRPMSPPALPANLGGYRAQAEPLNVQEQAYFAAYGGGAARAAYGPYALLTVSTTAPLRHLHAPDECLRGAGHTVRYVGLAQAAVPTALYRSVDADGRRWRIAVSYLADDGSAAASVSEAVWRWLRAPGRTWTMVQRISPEDAPADARDAWDAAVLRAFDHPSAAPSLIHLVPSA